jgi:uncharacterized membrane protein
MKKIRKFLKENLIAGILITLPIYVTVVVLIWLLDVLSGIGDWLPESIHPTKIFPYPGVGLAWDLLLTFVMLLLIGAVGVASKNLLFGKFLKIFEGIVERLPILRSVYSGLRQVLAASLGTQNTKNFNRVVYVRWPHSNMWTLAFVTDSTPKNITPINDEAKNLLSVYVPTTPNPTGGYWVLVPESETRDADMSVEEAFKTVLSLGIAQNH